MHLHVKVLARLSCPFCAHARTVAFGYANGDEATGTPIAVHQEPRCRQFEVMDILEFMRAARLAGAKSLPLAPEPSN